MQIIRSLTLALCLLTPTWVFADSPEPSSDDQKTLYALGLAMSQSLASFGLSETELEQVKAGLTDGVLKHTPKVNVQEFMPKVQQLQQARASVVAEGEKKEGAAFLAKAAAEKGQFSVSWASSSFTGSPFSGTTFASKALVDKWISPL